MTGMASCKISMWLVDMTVRDALRLLKPSRTVMICDIDQMPLEEGIAGGLLDESCYLDSPAVYAEDDTPYLIVAGMAV